MRQRIKQPNAWVGHIPFAYYLVEKLKPKTIVELGTHTGNSFIAFCEACKLFNNSAKLFAVDLWKGDRHAGYYDEDIYTDLKEYVDHNYPKNVKLIRKNFNEAVFDFEDKSIDCLHIDGLHTYEAVKNDFESWLPKLKDRAIVLFHDTEVYHSDFGVYKYWNELINLYKANFNFKHSNGLGVLIISKDPKDDFITILKEDKWLIYFLENSGNNLIELHSITNSYNQIKSKYERSINFRFSKIKRKLKRILSF